MSDDPNPADLRHDPDAALRLIRAAHTAGGRTLDRSETIAFILKPVNFGHAAPLPTIPGARGRKSKRTQYDRAYQRRKGLFQRLVRLPALRNGTGCVDVAALRDLAQKLSASTPKHKLVAAIVHKLARAGDAVPDESTIRKALRKS